MDGTDELQQLHQKMVLYAKYIVIEVRGGKVSNWKNDARMEIYTGHVYSYGYS